MANLIWITQKGLLSTSLSLFLRRSFFARISYPWVSVSNWWSHGSVKTPWQPKKKSQKNQGSKSVEQQLPFTITVPSPDSSSNWIRCSLFFSCRLYILHFGYNTHMYHNIMLYASLNFSSFMIVLVVGGSNSKMWFPSFQSINFGKVVHTYYRSKEAVNLCRRSSFRGIIWWDFVRKKYPEIIKKRKERIYAIMLADSLESLVGKIISYNTCILFLALIFFISRTYWVLLDDAFVPFFLSCILNGF